MPIKTFSESSITQNSVSNTNADPAIALSTSGTTINKTFSGLSSTTELWDHSKGSIITFGVGCSLNSAHFPTIPDSALITSIRCTCRFRVISVPSYLGGVGAFPYVANVNTLIHIGFPIGSPLAPLDPLVFQGGVNGPQHSPGTSLSINTLYDVDITVPLGGISKTTFFATYGSLYSSWDSSGSGVLPFNLSQSFGNGSVGGDPATTAVEDINYSVSCSGWQLEVTYDLENFRWFIKPTIKIVNGIPVRIIQDATTDIVQVFEGEEPPEVPYGELPFEFYGTSEDYPIEVEYVWWSSPDFWYFFIYSPIAPTVINTPWAVWTPFPVGEVPTCTGCLTLELGSLDVLVANASGVYTLQLGKTNDTLYNRDTEDTTDVKIPNPYGKTSFIP